MTAHGDMTVLTMFGADFALLCEQIPELHAQIEQALEERLPSG